MARIARSNFLGPSEVANGLGRPASAPSLQQSPAPAPLLQQNLLQCLGDLKGDSKPSKRRSGGHVSQLPFTPRSYEALKGEVCHAQADIEAMVQSITQSRADPGLRPSAS